MTPIEQNKQTAKYAPHALVNTCYYAAFFLNMLVVAINYSEVFEIFGMPRGPILVAMQEIAILLLIYKYLFQQNSLLQHAVSGTLILLGLSAWHLTGVDWLFWIAAFVVTGKEIDFKTIAWIVFLGSLLFIVVLYTLANTGVIENLTITRVKDDGAQIIRHAFGFIHPNTLGTYLVMVCAAFSTIRYNKAPWLDLIPIAISLFINMNWLDSRASLLACIMLAVFRFVFYYVHSNNVRRVILFCCGFSVMTVILVSFWFFWNFDETNALHLTLDKLLSSRLRLAYEYHRALGPVKPFGYMFAGLDGMAWGNYSIAAATIDNVFAHLLLRVGYIPTTVFCLSLAAFYIRSVMQNRWDIAVAGSTVMLIYGFFETAAAIIGCNFFLVTLASLMYTNERGVPAQTA